MLLKVITEKNMLVRKYSGKLLTLFFLVAGITAFGYAQDLNKFDANGKKHGKWTRLMDKNWNTVEDSSKAAFFRYTFYDHGQNVHPMGGFGKNKLWKMKSSIDTSTQKGIKLLDGEYKWFDPKGRLMYWLVLKDGVFISYKEFYETGELHQFFDYTKHAEGQPWSWYMVEYNKDGSCKYQEQIKKDEKGKWPPMAG
jgi:hypothetical protein